MTVYPISPDLAGSGGRNCVTWPGTQFRRLSALLPPGHLPRLRYSSRRSPRGRRFLVAAGLMVAGIWLAPGGLERAIAQAPPVDTPTPASAARFPLPEEMPPPPTLQAAPPGQYVLEFNRSPVVGNRLRFTGIYDERRLWFTRPRNWQPKSVQVLLRYRHSAALYATRSNLTVLINGTSIGSLPLNQREGEIGEAVFDIPLDLLQDHNELVVAALQNNSPTCTQDPYDPSLWSEVLPDSKLVFDFQPQPITPDFRQFPYPLFDTLSLQTNQIAYLLPGTVDESWLTPTTRLQTALGRIARYRPLATRVVQTLEGVSPEERLVIIGTPTSQPILADLDLPFALVEGQFRDGEGNPLPEDVGVLMWTTTAADRVPVLVASGNGATGVAKAVQFLVQPQDQQIAVGHGVLVHQVAPVATPPVRDWPGYLPTEETFQLKDLTSDRQEPLTDMTVRGSHAPALQVDFKALPDDQFLPGSEIVLRYSYGPQINPLTSLVEVELDGVALDGERLTAVEGAKRETLQVSLPAERITPFSQLQVNFRLDPRERRSCSRVTDQQLWGTIHADTQFVLKRQAIARMPDLQLLRTGFPFTAPQDLSRTALVVPDRPRPEDVTLLLTVAERLGRVSQAETVNLEVFRGAQLPEAVRRDRHLIALGAQATFPLPAALTGDGLRLQDKLSRQWGGSQVQTLPDAEGMMKAVISPWNSERLVLALSAQADTGLVALGDLVDQDALFYQLEGDTALISRNRPGSPPDALEGTPSLAAAPSPDAQPPDAQLYELEFLRQSPQVQLATTPTSHWVWRLLRSQGFLLIPGFLVVSLLIYGMAQAYLHRADQTEE